MMLEIGDSVMTHRRQYARAGRRSLIDLLALDPLNPRSVLFQLDRLKHEIAHLPEAGDRGHLSPAAKDMLRIHTALATKEPGDLPPAALETLADDIAGLYSSLAKAYFA
jgi:uncharacterized alpha-E superfamily protein